MYLLNALGFIKCKIDLKHIVYKCAKYIQIKQQKLIQKKAKTFLKIQA